MSLIKINQRSSNTLIGTNLDSRLDTIIAATGGTITTDGNFKVHTFTSSGDFVISSVQGLGEVKILVVGGGGGGAYYGGGGAGAGGFNEGTYILSAGTFVVTIGAGGNGKTSGTVSYGNGSTSSVNPTAPATVNGEDLNIRGYGGGSGAPGTSGNYTSNWYPNNWSNYGGSSAGAPGLTTELDRHTYSILDQGHSSSQGHGGGAGVNYGNSTSFIGGGGGGGAATPGANAYQGGGPIGMKGNGGTGKESAITGTITTYAGGGGGGYGSFQASSGGGSGGSGGGGRGGTSGLDGVAGTANTGGGGGGGGYTGSYTHGKNGGSGIVIFRYRFQ
tara:strand:- start:1205 stop:2197 length:993 start_codon:yes stop_codon:yes gene_type:complete